MTFTVTNRETMAYARQKHAMCYLKPYVYVFGGSYSSFPMNQAERFTTSWSDIADIPNTIHS
jgi:hypothetical protein